MVSHRTLLRKQYIVIKIFSRFSCVLWKPYLKQECCNHVCYFFRLHTNVGWSDGRAGQDGSPSELFCVTACNWSSRIHVQDHSWRHASQASLLGPNLKLSGLRITVRFLLWTLVNERQVKSCWRLLISFLLPVHKFKSNARNNKWFSIRKCLVTRLCWSTLGRLQ